MKLLYAQGACSLSIHVFLEEVGAKYEAECVSIDKKGPELFDHNAFGYVPVLILDSGEVMTEAIAILQYLAQQFPENKLMPAPDTHHWRKGLQWLSYMSSEVHQKAAPLFHKDGLTKGYLEEVQTKLESRIGFMDSYLIHRKYLVGDEFSIADMYALAILRISAHVGVEIKNFSAVTRYLEMLEKIPSVKRALEVEDEARLKKSA